MEGDGEGDSVDELRHELWVTSERKESGRGAIEVGRRDECVSERTRRFADKSKLFRREFGV